jgi:methenyltetrahydromethanopterin cyclohydrolase
MQIKPSLNQIGDACASLLDSMAQNAVHFGLRIRRADCGTRVFFAESNAPESVRAGALVAALCQGGLAAVGAYEDTVGDQALPFIHSETGVARLATLTLQSACDFHGVMLSGPIKLHLDQSNEIEYDSDPQTGSYSAVVQADAAPNENWIVSLAKAAHCRPEQITLFVAPEASMIGATQIAGRMNENIIFTMERSLGLDSNIVAFIEGYSPICPPGGKSESGQMLTPDDFLHYGAYARVSLAKGVAVDCQKLADDLAFASTDIFGTLFSDLLRKAGGDFFKIPNLLHINKLAVVEVFDSDSETSYRSGSFRYDLLKLF